MCLCNGTGGINKYHDWGIKFIPCPDSNCTFDREKSWQDFLEWQERFLRECEQDKAI